MQATRIALWQSRRRLSQAIAARATATSSPPTSGNAFATTSTSDAGKTFYLATLPWTAARNGDAAAQAQAFRVEETAGIVASSMSSTRRLSPIARSLADKIGQLGELGNDSWLLLRASSLSQAQDIVKSRFTDGQENARVRSIELPDDVQSAGPLYISAAEKILAQAPADKSVNTSGPLYGK